MEAAFFDLDKTVIAKASIAAFGRTFYRGGLISRSTVLRALVSQFVYLHLGANEQKLASVRESVLELTKGWDQKEVSRLVREALDDIVEPIIYAEALDLIERHQAAGRLVYLVSASPEEIVRPLAGYLGARGSIASKAVVDADGRYTGEMDFYAYGPFKAEAMRRGRGTRGDRPERLVRLHGLLHGRADARAGRPPCRGQPRPGARPARSRAWMGGGGIHPACPNARPPARTFRDRRCHRRSSLRCRDGRCGGRLAIRPAAAL